MLAAVASNDKVEKIKDTALKRQIINNPGRLSFVISFIIFFLNNRMNTKKARVNRIVRE